MVRNKQEIVDEAYDIFCKAYDKFEKDPKWKQDYHFSWVEGVADIAERILINERIKESQKQRYQKSKQKKQNGKLKVVLKNSEQVNLKTNEEARNKVKDEHFQYDPDSKTWTRTMSPNIWNLIKDDYPFNKLQVEKKK